MKILKLYSIFAVLILSAVFIMWVMGFMYAEEALDVLKKTGSVLGVIFLATMIIQGITKPGSGGKPDQKR